MAKYHVIVAEGKEGPKSDEVSELGVRVLLKL